MKKQTIIALILVAVTLIGSVAFFISLGIRNQKDPVDLEMTDNSDTMNNSGTTESPIELPPEPEALIAIPLLDGNPILPEERFTLVDRNVQARIFRLCEGVPVMDDNGNYHLDEDTNLVYELTTPYDYSNVSDNTLILLQHFADMGYSTEANMQIQRFYFEHCILFCEMETDLLIDKLSACFPQSGTTPEALTEKASEIFGFMREDGYPFVFESVASAEITVHFCDVVPNEIPEVSANEEKICLYQELIADESEGHDRNLEAWLHKIIHFMSEAGCSEKSILCAQLLYTGSLADTEYRPDVFITLNSIFGRETEPDTAELIDAIHNRFGVDVNENTMLMDYLDGQTVYDGKDE